jgi:hypothetical protein
MRVNGHLLVPEGSRMKNATGSSFRVIWLTNFSNPSSILLMAKLKRMATDIFFRKDIPYEVNNFPLNSLYHKQRSSKYVLYIRPIR